jgi:CRISPR-associated endonuclease/helicase Cas3
MAWKQELDFVNDLLDEKFKAIVGDKDGQSRILNDLGNAAFQGDKNKVEKTVREVFSANITLHEEPHDILDKIRLLSWVNLDVRVLEREGKKHGIEIWKLEYADGKNEEESGYKLSVPNRLFPYDHYILNPRYVRYDKTEGLLFGEEGGCMDFIERDRPDEWEHYTYEVEAWRKHVETCLSVFDEIKNRELPLKLLSKCTGLNEKNTEGVLALSVALHDLGKLNKDWQRAVGVQNENSEPLAHFSEEFQHRFRPPHAVVSGYALYPVFDNLLENTMKRVIHSIILAISHHHHSRSENVFRYNLGWRALIRDVIREVNDRFGLYAEPDYVIWNSAPSTVKPRFPDIEKIKTYTVYSLASRIIRLCDQEASALASGGKSF